MEGPLITIIVPIYNVAVYMDRCVDSILTQTYRSLEVILVDDGSADGSAGKCDQWAQRDPRVKVIHQANAGLSMARNTALDIMTGEYVMMVDGDDYIAPHAVATLLSLITSTGAGIAAAGWCLFADGTEPAIDPNKDKQTTFTSSEAINDVFYQHTLTNSACNKLFKSSIFKTLRFPQGLLYEDLAIIYDLLGEAGTIAHTTTMLYFYRQRTDGSITSTFTRQRANVIDIMEGLEQRIAGKAPQHLKAVRSRLLSAYFNIFLLCPQDGSMDDIIDRCWTGIKRLRKDCLLDSNVRLKNKLGILLSHLGRQALRFFKH